MLRSNISTLALVSLSLPLLVSGAGRSTKAAASSDSTKAKLELKQRATSQLANLPIYFEPNRGQTDPSVSYLANIGSTRLFLTRDSAVFAIQKPNQKSGAPTVVRMRTVGANRGGEYQAVDRLPGRSNYLIGQDSSKWVTDVPQYGKVKRSGVYPGIDLVYYGNQSQFEYDFVLSPGADPNRIELAYDGVDSIHTNELGDLVLVTGAGNFIQKKPKVFQERHGMRTEVASNYRIEAGKSVRFEVAQYDRSRALVIDPVIVFNAIVGGGALNKGYAVAIDSSLNVYVAGTATEPDFPLVSAYQSTFTTATPGSKTVVFKLNSSGSALLYSTYLGGEGSETGLGIAVDSSGNAIVASSTNSHQYPVVAAAQGSFGGAYDGAVSKLNPSGSALVYSTYLGGAVDDSPQGVAVDSSGNAYVAGVTDGSGFPVTTGAFQTTYGGGQSNCTVTKYGSSGNLVYSSYLGGNGKDSCSAVAADSSGNAYVTGFTSSANFPVTNGAAQTVLGGSQNAFVTKVNSVGTATVYSTYYGGSSIEYALAIAVDSQGAAYITGNTSSTNLPLAGPIQSRNLGYRNAFVAKIAQAGNSFGYSTYLGGSKADSGNGIAVDGSGNVYVVGATLSADFPTSNAVLTTKPGVGGVIMKSSDGGVTFSASDHGINQFTATHGATSFAFAGTVLIATINGSIFESFDSGSTWLNVGNSTPVIGLAQSLSLPSTIYGWPVTPSYFWLNSNASSTSGYEWDPLPLGSAGPASFAPTGMSVSPSSPSTVLASGSGGIWLNTSPSTSSTWTQTGGILSGVNTTAVAFRGDSVDGVACTAGGAGVYRTSGSLAGWALSNSGIGSGSVCTGIVVDPNNAGIVYILASDGVYKSTNAGSTWFKLSNLPLVGNASNAPVLAVAPGNSSILVAGGVTGGVYRSTDGGNTWTASSSLTSTPIQNVAISPSNSNIVYVSTDLSGEGAGFATSLNSGGGGPNYSTFLGAPGGTNQQGAQAVAVDSSGDAFIVGQTGSPFYGPTAGAIDEGPSGAVNIFVMKISPSGASCSVSVANTSIQAYSPGGSYPIEIFAPAGCAWTATPGASWVSLSGPSSGTGSAATTIVVGANSGSSRSTTIAFTTGQSITVNQDASSCSYGFSTTTGAMAATAGSGSASLNVGAGCGWTAISSEPWLTITNASGSGSATINYTITANANTSARSATIMVDGATYTVTQAAGSGSGNGANYVGSVDSTTCSGIVGWAADRNRLNVSIVVTLIDASTGTAIASTTANGSRPDVGAAIGDNGLHGFSLQIPSTYQNGVSHTYQVRYETSTTAVGANFTLTCGSGGTSYVGSIDSSSCSGIVGWAADRSRLNTSIIVSLIDASSGTSIATTTANISRPDVGTALGDNGLHGFNLQIPSNYQNGVGHTYQVRYETSSTQLGSNITLTCGSGGAANYTGHVDVSACGGITGWAANLNALNTSITVALMLNGSQIASTTANISRPDVGSALGDNGLHGFTLQIPSQYQNGSANSYQIVYGSTTTQVPGSPVTLTCGSSGTPNYTGHVDVTSCGGITGWAANLNALNSSITVSLMLNGSQIASTTANISRPDVGSALGDNGLHGFTLQIPSQYQNGSANTYQIVYGTTTTQVPGSPVTLTCGSSGTPNYTGHVDVSACGGITGWAANLNALNSSITVSLLLNGSQIASTTANISRPDVGSALGDNGLHGFTLQIPSQYQNGSANSYQIVYGSTTTQVPGSPVTLTCGSGGTTNYTGNVDSYSCSAGIKGWAADRNRLNTSIVVSLYDISSGSLIASTTANGSRPDVGTAIGDNGLHGFDLAIPSGYQNGASHTYQIRYESSATQLPGSPVTLSCGSGATNYAGNVDVLSCTSISGWVANLGALNTSLTVNVTANGQLIASTFANISRPDVGAAIGDNGLHGFNLVPPTGLRTGQPFTINVSPSGSSYVIAGSGTLTCN